MMIRNIRRPFMSTININITKRTYWSPDYTGDGVRVGYPEKIDITSKDYLNVLHKHRIELYEHNKNLIRCQCQLELITQKLSDMECTHFTSR